MLQNELFYCDHLGVSENDEQDIMNFTVKNRQGQGLLNYLRYMAFQDEANSEMRTYMIRDNISSELVAYFSLKAGLISLNEVHTESGVKFDTLPGVEIANFAVNQTYASKHDDIKEIGFIVYSDFILPLIREAAKMLGIKIVYIFSLPIERLINRYKEYGFLRLDNEPEDVLHKRLKPNYDEDCIFMYRPLH